VCPEKLQTLRVVCAAGFPFPITLTMWHMLFCSVLAFVLVKTGVVAAEPSMDREKCATRPMLLSFFGG
jgi:hypothetical protein